MLNINGSDIEIMGNSNIPRGAFLTQPYTNMYNSQEDASSVTREFASTGFNNPAIMVSSCAATVPDHEDNTLLSKNWVALFEAR